MPKLKTHRFASGNCRQGYWNVMRRNHRAIMRELRAMDGNGDEKQTVTDEQAEANRRAIDRKIGAILSGDIQPIQLDVNGVRYGRKM